MQYNIISADEIFSRPILDHLTCISHALVRFTRSTVALSLGLSHGHCMKQRTGKVELEQGVDDI